MESSHLVEIRERVERVLSIESVTIGTKNENFQLRYRGQLRLPSEDAYDQLEKDLRKYGQTPIFRKEGEDVLVLIVNQLPAPGPSRPVVHAVLFLFTLLSMVFAGVLYSLDEASMTAAGGDFFQLRCSSFLKHLLSLSVFSGSWLLMNSGTI